jgi:hypothetical protein
MFLSVGAFADIHFLISLAAAAGTFTAGNYRWRAERFFANERRNSCRESLVTTWMTHMRAAYEFF